VALSSGRGYLRRGKKERVERVESVRGECHGDPEGINTTSILRLVHTVVTLGVTDFRFEFRVERRAE
jgi:hypothetical protein